MHQVIRHNMTIISLQLISMAIDNLESKRDLINNTQATVDPQCYKEFL